MDDTKPWIQSRTLWLNALSFVAAALVWATQQAWVSAHPDVATMLASALALANMAMRMLTSQPLGPVPGEPTAPRV